MFRMDEWDDVDEGLDAAIIRRPHAQAIEQVANQVQGWFPNTNVYLEGRHRARGRSGPQMRWPDLQFIHPTRHRATHIEIDTTAQGMRDHIADHQARNPNRRGVFLQVHPRTGAIMRKVVIAAGSNRHMVDERRSRANPVIRLNRTDVFDAFEG